MILEQLDRWEQYYLLQSIGRTVIDFPRRSKVIDRMYEKGLIAGAGVVYGHCVTFAKTDLGNNVLRDFVEPDGALSGEDRRLCKLMIRDELATLIKNGDGVMVDAIVVTYYAHRRTTGGYIVESDDYERRCSSINELLQEMDDISPLEDWERIDMYSQLSD
jgi:hypothetical protein